MTERIVLASGSPRRKQLLEWAEVDFEVIVADTPETYPAGLPVGLVPVHIARNKALAVKKQLPADRIVLAADTVVVLDGDIIGKPRDRDDAVSILTRLAGNQHEVITGVILSRGQQEIAFADSTAVYFHELTKTQIETYVDKYRPFDKAGAYAIQEWIGVVGIRGIEGDFYNVMGLPVSRVVQELGQLTACRV
ncbi:MAG: septum formation protein Maf [Chitinophagaceae bacterium]|nr:septum formation protein Maf [Chitinophagaceae bacterium]